MTWLSSLRSVDEAWLSACCSMLLSGNVLAIAVELTAALVAEEFAEYLLLDVYRATFTAAART